jgi:hypothetical protein
MALVLAPAFLVFLVFVFWGGGGHLEKSPLGLVPLLRAWLRGFFVALFLWPCFVNKIPPVKTN